MAKKAYVGVADKARKVKKIYVGVDNVARNVRKGYVSVNNAARLFFQYGKTLGEYTEGDIVYLNENGTPTAFYVACHNYNSDLNGTGRTLLVRKDIHSKMAWDERILGVSMQTTTEYDKSTIDSWCNDTYFNLLDPNVQSAVGTTKFVIASDGSIEATLVTIERAVFVLALREVGLNGVGYAYALEDGTAVPIAELLRIANLNGTATGWWTRSPYTVNGNGGSYEDYEDSSYYNERIWSVSSAGKGSGQDLESSSYGARPVFTLPASTLFNAATNEFLGV